METYDVLIIGGGPAGLRAEIMLGRSCRRVLVIDSGEPRNLRALQVNGYLGLPVISPTALRECGEEQARIFDVNFLHGVVEDAFCPNGTASTGDSAGAQTTMFQLRLQDGSRVSGRKLLFATGIRDELPLIPGFSECYGRSIHRCPYCDGWEHRDQRLVALAESSQSAISLAKILLAWSKAVTVATNGTYLADNDKEELESLGIRYREPGVASVEHDNGQLRALLLTSGERLEVDALFFSARSSLCCSLPLKLGCRRGEKGTAETTDRQGTGVPGVFLAGDADGDVQFAIVAAAEGAIAATAIHKELQREDLRMLARTSTSVGSPD